MIGLFFFITRIVNGRPLKMGCIAHKNEIGNVNTTEKSEAFLIVKYSIIFTVKFSSVLEILWCIS